MTEIVLVGIRISTKGMNYIGKGSERYRGGQTNLMKRGRTRNSATNIGITMTGQFASFLISFIARIFFIRILGVEYLGLNGLFTNILTMLSLMEMGVGPAITYSLYKPLSEDDSEKVKTLMMFFKKTYTIIGILITVAGFCLIPFLGNIIKDVPVISHLKLIFILFLINSSISYFYSYKRTLIIADQQKYIDSIYKYLCFFVLNILQIIILCVTKQYLLFLIIQIISTLSENILVSRKADRMYPYLKDRNVNKLDKNSLKQITKNTSALILHKIGSIVVSSTDNIVISSIIGIVWVGIYSNYLLIMNGLNAVLTQIFTSLASSVGNMIATEDTKKSEGVFHCLLFINFWIYGYSSICVFILFNPFIELWVGKDFLLSLNTVTILVFNYYLTGMRKAVLTFKDANGLFWNDRYKPIFEVVINIGASILLAYRMGITGVFIGTAISMLLTCFWVEPYILYKYAFHKSCSSFFTQYILYSLAVIFSGICTYYACSVISGSLIIQFVIKMLICLAIPNTIFIVLFHKRTEYTYLMNLLKKVITYLLRKMEKHRSIHKNNNDYERGDFNGNITNK